MKNVYSCTWHGPDQDIIYRYNRSISIYRNRYLSIYRYASGGRVFNIYIYSLIETKHTRECTVVVVVASMTSLDEMAVNKTQDWIGTRLLSFASRDRYIDRSIDIRPIEWSSGRWINRVIEWSIEWSIDIESIDVLSCRSKTSASMDNVPLIHLRMLLLDRSYDRYDTTVQLEHLFHRSIDDFSLSLARVYF